MSPELSKWLVILVKVIIAVIIAFAVFRLVLLIFGFSKLIPFIDELQRLCL